MAIVKAQASSSSLSPSPTSSSTSKSSYTYDVFLSFRGKDTRKNFSDHLYAALVNKGFRTFRDNDQMHIGKSLKPELDKAIKQSRVSIIVFSKDYASSTWCLNELVMILDRKRTSEHDVLPVFYNLSPSEVRNQSGGTGEAFARHEHSNLKEKVEGWKAALKEVANLAGMELKNEADGYESKFVQKITDWVGEKVRRTPFFVAPKLIGMDSRAKHINKWLQDDSSKVILRGICGMGGIGKTTIAKFVYNENYRSFDASCFLADVRERSKNPRGLASLQRQLLSSILNKQHEKIYNVDEGMMMIKDAISHKRVLLILDDVDHIDQLNALHGMQDWFCQGSKIIITTRDEMLLMAPENALKVEELDYNDSVKLFSFYAFGKDCPNEDYIAHTIRVVQLCGGLPLALQVIGSSLFGRTVPYWASAVKKLEAIPPKEILDKLKISYDCLEDDIEKRIFLDIACFFVGEDVKVTIEVLDCIPDTYAAIRIQRLIERYMLTINSCNKLMMHQLVRDMGKNIVRQESPEDPGKRSRLHHYKDVYDVLENETNLKSLKILDLSYSASLVKTPNFLGVPKLEKLILEACVSLIDCESIEILQKLILLDLTNCKNLRKLPNNMHKLGSLETLIVGWSNLFNGGNEISATQPRRGPEMLWASLPYSLVRLSLVRCNLFDDSLPFAFSNLSRLKYLDLGVNLFRSLPECIKGLSSLQWLSLAGCQSLSSILGLPSNLQYLDVSSLNVMPLRRITFQSTPDQLNEIHTFCCCNLVEIEGILKREPIEKVDRRIIKNLGIDIESIKNLKVKRVIRHAHDVTDPIHVISLSLSFSIFLSLPLL
ncbi:hypothetical protein LguiA_007523 [Lonicera macranthoides]